MKSMKGYATAVALIWLFIVLFVAIGWVMNIMDIINSSFEPITTLLVMRFIGIVMAPLGAILGWLF